MSLNILHTISGILIILVIAGKIILHFFLDKSRNENVHAGSLIFMPLYYLKPYMAEVGSKYILLKNTCNILLPIAAILLLLNLVLGILIYLRGHLM